MPNNSDSDNDTASLMIKKASKITFDDAIRKICVDEKIKNWLINAHDNFPFFTENDELDLFLKNPDNLDVEKSSKTANKKSINKCLEKLKSALTKFEDISDFEGLKKVRDVNRAGVEILKKDKNIIGDLNLKIGKIRSDLYSKFQDPEIDLNEEFNLAKEEIVGLIKLEISNFNDELSKLQSQNKITEIGTNE